MKKISFLGRKLRKEDKYLKFEECHSLTDTDILVVNLNFEKSYFMYESPSLKLREIKKYWKQEFNAFFKNGNNIYFILNENKKVSIGYYYDRNDERQEVILDTYEFIEEFIKTSITKGKDIVPVSTLGETYLQKNFKYTEYRVEIREKKNLNPILLTSNRKKIVSAYMNKYEGHLIFLPHIPFLKLKKEEQVERFLSSITGIEKQLTNIVEEQEFPDWIGNSPFIIKNSEVINQKILEVDSEISALKSKKEELFYDLIDSNKLYYLLFEQGKN